LWFANSIGWQYLAGVGRLPELMSLRPCPQKQKRRASLPQNFPLNPLEQRAAVERSLFEPAEHRPAQRETESESSRRLPEPEFQVGQVGSPVALPRRGWPWSERFEVLEQLPVAKILARQSERQLAFVREYRESFCRSIPGKPRAQLPLLALTARQLRRRCASGDAAELLSAGERLSSTGDRIDRTARVGAQFSPEIDGSSPTRPTSPLDADRDRDATSCLTRRATALEIGKTLDHAEAPQLRVLRR